ncbi:hypothetical protein ACE1SV_25790 [Streptomyces sp. E-15]
MFARRLEQVRDFEDVAGDLEVVVAVHRVRWSSAEEWGAGAGRRYWGDAYGPPGSRAGEDALDEGSGNAERDRAGMDSGTAGAGLAQQL